MKDKIVNLVERIENYHGWDVDALINMTLVGDVIDSVHLKSGNLYKLVDIALDATNGVEDQLMAVYIDAKYVTYVRKFEEFLVKFSPLDKYTTDF